MKFKEKIEIVTLSELLAIKKGLFSPFLLFNYIFVPSKGSS